MIYYISSVILWPIVILVDFFLRFKNHFKKSHSVHILNYHSISSDIKKRGFGYHSVSRNVFSKQMKYLAENDYNVIDLDDFIQLKEKRRLIPPKTVILTFDDGFADNYTLAFPVISKYSLKAVLSVITEYINRNRPFPWLHGDGIKNQNDREEGLPLSKKQLKVLSDYGITIASHTRSHRDLGSLSKEEVRKEVSESKRDLEDILGRRIEYFTYPYGTWGNYDEKDKRIIQSAGYKAALSTKVGGNHVKSDFYELRRIPIYNIDGLSNFKRKLNGAYDFTGFLQYFGFKLKKFFI
jgi:peptidoglycan/xylan/chitin deacetylase (PgdA/CDA1 family)